MTVPGVGAYFGLTPRRCESQGSWCRASDIGFPWLAGCASLWACAGTSPSKSAPPIVPVWKRSSRTGSPQKHVWRAKIILATADGLGTAEIMRRSGKSKPSVWRWQERFMTDGVDGLLRDKTRYPALAADDHRSRDRAGRDRTAA